MDLSTHRTSEEKDDGGSSPLTAQQSQPSVRKSVYCAETGIEYAEDLTYAEMAKIPFIAKLRREDRNYHAAHFRRQYVYGLGTTETVTCIWSTGSRIWQEKSSGIMWVCVHGTDSVCVVTRREDLDLKRVHAVLARSSAQKILSLYRISIICQIEDLADPSSEVRQRISWGIEKPCGVVSVLPKHRIEEGREVGVDNEKAVNFLREKMSSGTNFTVTETIQTAISAFQLLFEKKLEANEIGVSFLDPLFFLENTEENEDKDITIQEIKICEIEKCLAAINEPGQWEMKEHVGVTDEPSPPSKRTKTSLVLDTPGGSKTTSDSME